MSSRRMKFQALRTSCRIGRASLLLLALTVLLVLAPWDADAAAAAAPSHPPEPEHVDTTVDGETPLSTRLTGRRLEEGGAAAAAAAAPAGNETAQQGQAQDAQDQPSQESQPVETETETETVVPEPLPATTTTTAPPTTVPTHVPTVIPTVGPTNKPTLVPTVGPTKATTLSPTTLSPTSQSPTLSPVTSPPTSKPTHVPTKRPTDLPTARPTQHPTSNPTIDTSPSIAFSEHFGDGMVLQRAPSASVVYGTLELDPALFVVGGDDGYGSANHTALADQVLVDVTLQGSEGHLQTRIVPAAVAFPSSLSGSGGTGGGGAAAATGAASTNAAVATFRAVLPPVESSSSSSHSYSVYARCKSGCPPARSATASLKNVQFGDVWFCAGGNNMVQPLQYTFGRNASAQAVRAGRYGSIRYRGLGLDGNGGGYDVPWTSPMDALNDGDGDDGDGGTFYKFSAACWYFAEGLVDRLGGGGIDGNGIGDGDDIGDDDDGGGGPSLVDRLGGGSGGASAPLPIGLIQVSSLYSTIEDWMDDDALNECDGTMSPRSLNDGAGIYGTAIHPLTQMTIKGWVWYQGSTNMPGQFGNSTTGYACLLPSLIRSWRKSWSVYPGTTHPNAPFGLVTVNNDPTGSRGWMDVGGMRRAQTAGYGTVPNPAMPHAFWAQGYDLDDPYADATCYDKGCCDPGLTFFAATDDDDDDGGNAARPKPKPCVGQGCNEICASCKSYCDALAGTNFFLGPEQPRIKRVVGHRLAQAAAVSVYGQVGHSTGPTLAGCRVLDSGSGDSGGDSSTTIVLHFERRVLGGDRVVVQPYSREYGTSRVEVLVDPDAFCLQRKEDSDTHMVTCVDDGGSGGGGSTGSGFVANWVSVDVDSVGPYDVAVNLTKSGGVAYAVRYAWEGSCCPPGHPTGEPCPVASCPLMGNASNLPANPFVAKIVDGKCECLDPQRCDASIGLRAFTFHVRDVPINDVSLAILATLGVGALFLLACCVRVCCRKCCGKKKSEVEGYEMVKLTEIPGDDDKVDDYEVW